LLEKVLGADMDSSEVDMTNIFTSNEDLKWVKIKKFFQYKLEDLPSICALIP
jgi:hypothetical protein